jgi:hypothetical protein
LDTLPTQTLAALRQEVTARAAGVQLFFDQVAAELRFLADMSNVGALLDAIDEGSDTRRLECGGEPRKWQTAACDKTPDQE